MYIKKALMGSAALQFLAINGITSFSLMLVWLALITNAMQSNHLGNNEKMTLTLDIVIVKFIKTPHMHNRFLNQVDQYSYSYQLHTKRISPAVRTKTNPLE